MWGKPLHPKRAPGFPVVLLCGQAFALGHQRPFGVVHHVGLPLSADLLRDGHSALVVQKAGGAGDLVADFGNVGESQGPAVEGLFQGLLDDPFDLRAVAADEGGDHFPGDHLGPVDRSLADHVADLLTHDHHGVVVALGDRLIGRQRRSRRQENAHDYDGLLGHAELPE